MNTTDKYAQYSNNATFTSNGWVRNAAPVAPKGDGGAGWLTLAVMLVLGFLAVAAYCVVSGAI